MLTREQLVELMGTTQTRYFHDTFKSVDHINQAVTQTGYINASMHDLKLETGVQGSSQAAFRYTNPIYNPKYAIMQAKIRLSSMKDMKFWFGFCQDPTMLFDPGVTMVGRSFIGIMIEDNVLQAVAGNEDSFQKIALSDIDLTDNWLFRIEYDKIYTRPLPQIFPYFDGIRVVKTTREWALAAQLGSAQPENTYHYINGEIQNTTGTDKTAEFKHITYSEEYAD